MAACVATSGFATYSILSRSMGGTTKRAASAAGLVIRLGGKEFTVSRQNAEIVATFLSTVSGAPAGASLADGDVLYRVRTATAMEAERRHTLLVMVRREPQDPGWTLAVEAAAAEAAQAANSLRTRIGAPQ